MEQEYFETYPKNNASSFVSKSHVSKYFIPQFKEAQNGSLHESEEQVSLSHKEVIPHVAVSATNSPSLNSFLMLLQTDFNKEFRRFLTKGIETKILAHLISVLASQFFLTTLNEGVKLIQLSALMQDPMFAAYSGFVLNTILNGYFLSDFFEKIMGSAVELPLQNKNFFDRDMLENLDPRLRHKLLHGFKKIFSSYFFHGHFLLIFLSRFLSFPGWKRKV
ncbi:hypothetical protein CleRT_09450 [Candidatus Coxiella mudrowiae]|uniref:Uncharacterized protein n=2 Tax=Candidatus Coxiella mudrowiae TaxID=2054173 RepID=A0ABM5UUQ5_9COXI|nr:hypothetical protein CleRT_09450 [Candidatus Coxiella mudrowiae]